MIVGPAPHEPTPAAKGGGTATPGAGIVIAPGGVGCCTGTNRTDPSGCGTFQPMSFGGLGVGAAAASGLNATAADTMISPSGFMRAGSSSG